MKERALKRGSEVGGRLKERRGKRKVSWLTLMRDQIDSIEDSLPLETLTDRAKTGDRK